MILPSDESYPPVDTPVILSILSRETQSALTSFAQHIGTGSVSKRAGVRLGNISLGTRIYKPWYSAPRDSLIHFGEQKVHGGLGEFVGHIHEIFFWPLQPVNETEVPEGYTLITVAVYGGCPSANIDPFPYTCARVCSTKIISYLIISLADVHGPVAMAPWRCVPETQVAVACPV